ncbi:aspartate--tRNA(Asp/Asn) ligase [Clostridium pasteurianum DSM 525 = ATCC 6013]|uniref:Aspartate--tRNA(Asp/Asn) ligase n=1 Tax=Clostridium pasteurianum DSM 525 = ATCC 6013 TaxID=1262449 RepID=A0A0H3J5S2_CLOPA|nr:aspartate--tRNA(Asn) ligase [Clostridium pasteurianum]AJA46280.1 aspartate--tRNA(Asp/Asn) ligase [Clostridium pasteurianum DSM 525 = ATCC 6013]AJA50268.1 aspartate--tRNA(Asp/Asn) ligase [Clostridium pasteurianum DSM 525 = ATCC 6013]AOZ73732.1 aspartate--tRNA(Asp/Asn) ligase [Clostridium pasteurianum DSM 525 = ATCC 6013]AOZ77529.1 aspartate--tRNA(Asp/Asn) ligase [Clostridium pasteurianum]ELP60864.1 aspartyl-tRNA ligase [Clostridium pasteurianum DSM 525 = ATCC 6013]
MKDIYVKDVAALEDGTEVELKGWVHKIYDLGKISFVKLRDKTGIIQIVIDESLNVKLRLEMCIAVKGKKVKNEKAPEGIEVQVDELKVLGKTYYDKLPFAINAGKIKAALETQLDHRTISLRAPKITAVFKVQEKIADAFKDYLKGQNFTEVYTPKIIASGTEGGSELFTVNYFDHRAFLAQSPQFYKQMMVGSGFERIFEIGHAYRAELHNTYRHLNEYVSLDLEMGFIEDEFEIMDLEEGFMNYLFKYIKKECSAELKLYNIELPEEVKIPRITLFDAQEILLKEYGKRSPKGNIDNEGEKLFAEYVKKEYGSDFVFLTKYPAAKRPMYTMPDDEIEGATRSFDLIYKGLEITTGGQRIHDYEELVANIAKMGFKTEEFEFYTDNFRYGMPPHGGLAIGLERLTMKILGLDNIREAALLPRDMKRITP